MGDQDEMEHYEAEAVEAVDDEAEGLCSLFMIHEPYQQLH